MVNIAGRGNCTRDDGVPENPFQEELCPRFAIELGDPVRQWLVPNARKKVAAGEGSVDQHRDAAVTRQGQETLVRRAVDDRVIDLEKIELLAPQDFLGLGKGGVDIVRDAEIADASLLLPAAHGGELGIQINQVVHLHEIEVLYAQARERALDRVDACLAAGGPNYGGEEQPIAQLQLTCQIADHSFSTTVHGRAVDRPASELNKTRQHFL